MLWLIGLENLLGKVMTHIMDEKKIVTYTFAGQCKLIQVQIIGTWLKMRRNEENKEG